MGLIKDPRERKQMDDFHAYLVGLSIGVHLLNWSLRPLALIYYFKNRKAELQRSSIRLMFLGGIALIKSSIILSFPAFPSFSWNRLRFFVNSLGLLLDQESSSSSFPFSVWSFIMLPLLQKKREGNLKYCTPFVDLLS